MRHPPPFRLAIVASHVVQYQAPLYRRLAGHPEIDLTVFYCSSKGAETYLDREMGVSLVWDVDLLDGYTSRFLKNLSPFEGEGLFGLINPSLPGALAQGRFDAVIFITGWGSGSSWIGSLACIANDIPFFFYGDSYEVPAEETFTQKLRARILRWLFSTTGGFLVSGKYNGDYYAHYGGDRSRFHLVPWAIDNERFSAAAVMPTGERAILRKRFGIPPDAVVVAFSGKLLHRKGPDILLEAFSRINSNSLCLLLLGDGAERASLSDQAGRLGVLDRVVFAGFINQQELPRMYGMSDIFVLPSRFEPRGAVVNEAMAAGLPCIVTDRVGASGDIVQHGLNGFVVPAGNVDDLADALTKLALDPVLRQAMGAESRRIIDRWGYTQDVEGILEALRAT